MRRIGCHFVLVLSDMSGYGQKPPAVRERSAKNIFAFTVGGEAIPNYSLTEDGVVRNRTVSVSPSYVLDIDYDHLLHQTNRHGELWLDVPGEKFVRDAGAQRDPTVASANGGRTAADLPRSVPAPRRGRA